MSLDANGQPNDAPWLRQSMQRVIDYLDSPEYARQVSWGEHLVLIFRVTRSREPSAVEVFLLTAYRDDIGLTRSQALSFVLRGRERAPTWGKLRVFLDDERIEDFAPDPSATARAERLAAVPRGAILGRLRAMASETRSYPRGVPTPSKPVVANGEYQTYFGYLHAHSELSDGEGSALEAYVHARDEGKLDFFALTDHGELLLIWPWESKWEELRDAAAATYEPGSYVTLWGFEWSNPILGHINVLNSSDYTNSVFDFGLRAIYNWMSARPQSFGRYNHPGRQDDLLVEFHHLRLAASAIPQMVGIETWNKDRSFDTFYYDGSWDRFNPFEDFSYWDAGNLRGWYLGPLGGEDNHQPNWGTRNDYRTAVLAESLTREDIVAAYISRRFYATEDKNLFLDLRVNGFPMGSRLTGVPRVFDVTASDASGDEFREVRLYRNGSLIATQTVSGNSIEASFSDDSASGYAYYYVVVRQHDDGDGNGRGDEAISSPIWIE